MRVVVASAMLAVASAFTSNSLAVRRHHRPHHASMKQSIWVFDPETLEWNQVNKPELPPPPPVDEPGVPEEALVDVTIDVPSDHRMRAVFDMVDTDGSGQISEEELGVLIRKGLNMATATDEEVSAIFRNLDTDGNGEIDYDEWWTWYGGVLEAMDEKKKVVYDALYNRRTTNSFDTTPVDDAVVLECVRAARYAPNHKMTEPWRFIQLGEETINKIAAMNAATIEDPKKREKKHARWANVPGWMVVTSRISEGDELTTTEDYAATCCAIQNFQLAMYAEGLGTKWTTGPITRTPEFYELVGVDGRADKVAGVIWYGFATEEAKCPSRKLAVEDVLSKRP